MRDDAVLGRALPLDRGLELKGVSGSSNLHSVFCAICRVHYLIVFVQHFDASAA